MDIYEYLKMDHEAVSALFKQFHDAPDKRKPAIAQLIADELIVHAKAEEETFYWALEHHYESRKEALHGHKEHQEIQAQIKKFDGLEVDIAQLASCIKSLEKLVKHHVKEEEGTVFKEAKEVLSEDEGRVIKEHMHYRKHQLLRERRLPLTERA